MLFAAIQDEQERQKAERLYCRYCKPMYFEAYGILHDKRDAEDAIQESFIRIMRNLYKIDENDVPKTRGFLTIICRNVALDIYHRQAGTNTMPLEDADSVPDWKLETEEIVINKETFARVKAAIEALAPKYRDVFLLKYAYGYRREEIASVFGLSVEAVKKRLLRAKQMIVNEFGKEELPHE